MHPSARPDDRSTTTSGSTLTIVLCTLPLAILLLAACGKAGDFTAGELMGFAEGSWTCRSTGDGDTIALEVDGDGRFEISASTLGDDRADEGSGSGGWKVVDQDLQISLDDTVARVIGGKGLGIDAGSLTMEVPSMDRGAKPDETEELTFSVVIEGKENVTITPTGDAANRYPSGAIDCTRD